MTGWYCSSLWIGHDDYQPLSSKVTGGNSAAPLWKEYMTKIHQAKNLSNRDILDGDPASYGLTLVTTCAVSGQLATEACRNDVMGYGVVTDYWYTPTVPTMDCQMHAYADVCAETNLLATPYCPVVVKKGIVVIPEGHPLHRFLSSTLYEPVLSEYLGISNTLGVCTYHQNAGVGGLDPFVQNTLIPDALTLIDSAQTLLYGLNAGSAQYSNIVNAINNLQIVINGDSPGSADVAGAMSLLTQAMAASY
jgi:penicillin-binding protein 1A